jgi:hypothetical protein
MQRFLWSGRGRCLHHLSRPLSHIYVGVGIVKPTGVCHIYHMNSKAVLTEKKLINLSPEMLARVSDYRFDNRINSESEAIRRLIEIGLETSGYCLKPDPGEAGE